MQEHEELGRGRGRSVRYGSDGTIRPKSLERWRKLTLLANSSPPLIPAQSCRTDLVDFYKAGDGADHSPDEVGRRVDRRSPAAQPLRRSSDVHEPRSRHAFRGLDAAARASPSRPLEERSTAPHPR